MRPQKTTAEIPAQKQPKSVLDTTVWELSEIEAYQSRNRGFRDQDRELPTRFSLDEEFGYYEFGEE